MTTGVQLRGVLPAMRGSLACFERQSHAHMRSFGMLAHAWPSQCHACPRHVETKPVRKVTGVPKLAGNLPRLDSGSMSRHTPWCDPIELHTQTPHTLRPPPTTRTMQARPPPRAIRRRRAQPRSHKLFLDQAPQCLATLGATRSRNRAALHPWAKVGLSPPGVPRRRFWEPLGKSRMEGKFEYASDQPVIDRKTSGTPCKRI